MTDIACIPPPNSSNSSVAKAIRVPPAALGENTNTNTFTLNLPASVAAQATRTEIGVLPQPLKIELDTPTDWPAVIATLAVGCAVAYFAWASQRSQIRSSTAGYRHSWMQALREAVLNFIAATSEINYKLNSDPDFATKAESDQIFRQLVTAQGAIQLMLDKKKGYTAEIIEAMDEIREAIRAVDENRIDKGVVKFTNKAQQVLELAWQDIRRDLHTNRKFPMS